MIASKIYQIDVTQEDIDAGKKQACMECPIALAIRRAIPDTRPAVSDIMIHVYFPNGDKLTADTPDEAAWFIEDFDNGHAVGPLSFTLEFGA